MATVVQGFIQVGRDVLEVSSPKQKLPGRERTIFNEGKTGEGEGRGRGGGGRGGDGTEIIDYANHFWLVHIFQVAYLPPHCYPLN